MVAIREAFNAEKADAVGQIPRRQRTMKERPWAFLGVRQLLSLAAGDADQKFNRCEVFHGSHVPSMDWGGNESAALAAPPRNPPSGHVQSAGRSPGLRMIAGDPAFPASRASGALDPLSGHGRGGGCAWVEDPFAFPFHLPDRAGTSTWRHFCESWSQVKRVSAFTNASETRPGSQAVCPHPSRSPKAIGQRDDRSRPSAGNAGGALRPAPSLPPQASLAIWPKTTFPA